MVMQADEKEEGAGQDAAGVSTAENLDDLIAEAKVLETPQAQPGAAVQAQAVNPEALANVRAIVGALKAARSIARPRFEWWQDFGTVWNDGQLEAIGEALEALRAHMGWDVGELMSKFGPWIALAMAAGMPAYATYEAIRERRAQLEAQRSRAPAATGGAAGGGNQ